MFRKLQGWLMLAVVLLSGCGGGGGDGGTSPFPGGDSSLAELRITLSSTQLVNDGSSSIVATVTAVSDANKVLSDIPVLVSADSAATTVLTTTTDSSGNLLATIGLGGNTTERTVTVTATSGTKSATATFKVVSGTTSSTAVTSLRVAMSASVVLPGNSVTATVTAVNVNNQVVPGAPVVFTSDNSAVTITAVGTSTDSSGQISAQVSVPSGFSPLPKDVLITAVESTSGAKGQGFVQVVDKSASESKVASVRVGLSAAAVANASGSTVTATVTAVDSQGVVVAGAPVVITTSGVGGTAGGVVTTLNPYTGVDGVMTSTIGYGSVTTPRTIEVMATSNGKVGTASFNVISGSVGGTATLHLSMNTDTVTASNPPTVTVQLLDEAGTPITGQVVTLTAKRGLAVFSASTLLTDSSGQKSAIVYPTSNTTTGADEIVASAVVSGKAISTTLGFQVSSSTVSIAAFTSDVDTVDAYGQANLQVDLNTVAGTPVGLSISSICVSKGKGKITPTSQTVTGTVAAFTYVDAGCGATGTTDTITVVVVGTTATKQKILTLGTPAASSLGFKDATPEIIYLKGSGFPEESIVRFIVKDQSGAALPGRDVVLSATTLAGGLTLNGGSVPVTQRSDADGYVSVRVNAGTVPTPVRILATLAGTNISTVSSNLSIRVGLPSQLNFSLSQDTLNIEGMDADGATNNYNIIASDRQGNPVPQGTTINFITEGGEVEASKQITLQNGLARASAGFLSSEPRPVDGRITVVAYAIGEESFLDLNGNNIRESGEPYQDLGDIFVSRMYKVGYESAWDQYFSLSLSASPGSCPADSGNPFDSTGLLGFNATLPSVTIDGSNVCHGHDNLWGRAYVRRAAETVLSRSSSTLLWKRVGNSPVGVAGGQMDSGCQLVQRTNQALRLDGTETVLKDGLIDPVATIEHLVNTPALQSKIDTYYEVGSGETIWGLGGAGTFSVLVADSNPLRFNPMPKGTVLSATASSGLAVDITGGSPIPNTSGITAATVSYQFVTAASGSLTISTTSPGGLKSSHTIYLSSQTMPLGSTACTK